MNESLLHCLFTCDRPKEVWSVCGFTETALPLVETEISQWLRDNISVHGIVVAVVLWIIWCSCNKMLFENITDSVQSLVIRVWSLVQSILNAYGLTCNDHLSTRLPREVIWQRPVGNSVVLNVDGSAISNPSEAGFGGLIRDSDGVFLKGFFGSVGVSSILYAEVMALYHGIQLCWNEGYKEVVCYSDSLHVVQLLRENVPFVIIMEMNCWS